MHACLLQLLFLMAMTMLVNCDVEPPYMAHRVKHIPARELARLMVKAKKNSRVLKEVKKKHENDWSTPNAEDYAVSKYWDSYYSNRGPEDTISWYGSMKEDHWVHMKDLVRPPGEDVEVFIPGCGNANTPQGFVDLGYEHVTAGDFSLKVISERHHLFENHELYKKIVYKTMDVTQMLSIPANSFDIIYEKAMVDVFFAGKDKEAAHLRVALFVEEVYRVLKPGGVFFSVSVRGPEVVLDDYYDKSRLDWVCSYYANEFDEESDRGHSMPWFMYSCKKAGTHHGHGPVGRHGRHLAQLKAKTPIQVYNEYLELAHEFVSETPGLLSERTRLKSKKFAHRMARLHYTKLAHHGLVDENTMRED